MKTYLYTIPNTSDPYGKITLENKPSIGELIVPKPNDRHPLHLEVKQVIHKQDQETLLIVMPYDFKKLHATY